jgi:hypothetical protein
MGLSLLATATRPRIADSVKGATSMYGSTSLTERPAIRKRMIPGMKAQTVMRRSWRAERCEFCSGLSMMCDFLVAMVLMREVWLVAATSMSKRDKAVETTEGRSEGFLPCLGLVLGRFARIQHLVPLSRCMRTHRLFVDPKSYLIVITVLGEYDVVKE